jgi:hypothetical protein
MVEFYYKLTVARMAEGMSRESALAKVPLKYRAQVQELLDN